MGSLLDRYDRKNLKIELSSQKVSSGTYCVKYQHHCWRKDLELGYFPNKKAGPYN